MFQRTRRDSSRLSVVEVWMLWLSRPARAAYPMNRRIQTSDGTLWGFRCNINTQDSASFKTNDVIGEADDSYFS
jgi:hypothetical protein